MRREWRDVRGQFTREIGVCGTDVLDLLTDKPITVLAGSYPDLAEDELYEIVIDFFSSGYYDSGSMYGGRDRLGWPPEGDDERVMESVSIFRAGNEEIKLDKKVQEELFDLYFNDINEVELDEP